jgi:tetratricopeptide (TPR) repeat protein
MEIAALSFDNVGLKEQAVKYYEKMYLENNNIGVLYRMAFLQYELKRFSEANASIDIMLDSPEASEQEVYFPINDKENQAVTLKAAVHRLRGMVYQAQGNVEEAKKSFLSALEVQGDFVLAQKQLAELNK